MRQYLEVGVVPQHEEAEGGDADGAQEGAGSDGGKLGEGSVGEDVEDQVDDGELQLLPRPQVVEEDGLAREGARQ